MLDMDGTVCRKGRATPDGPNFANTLENNLCLSRAVLQIKEALSVSPRVPAGTPSSYTSSIHTLGDIISLSWSIYVGFLLFLCHSKAH